MSPDPHEQLVAENKMAMLWQHPLADKVTQELNGLVSGWVIIQSEEDVVPRMARLKAAGILVETFPSEEIFILKGENGKCYSKHYGKAEFVEIPIEPTGEDNG